MCIRDRLNSLRFLSTCTVSSAECQTLKKLTQTVANLEGKLVDPETSPEIEVSAEKLQQLVDTVSHSAETVKVSEAHLAKLSDQLSGADLGRLSELIRGLKTHLDASACSPAVASQFEEVLTALGNLEVSIKSQISGLPVIKQRMQQLESTIGGLARIKMDSVIKCVANLQEKAEISDAIIREYLEMLGEYLGLNLPPHLQLADDPPSND